VFVPASVLGLLAIAIASTQAGYLLSGADPDDRMLSQAVEKIRSGAPNPGALVAVFAGHSQPLLNRVPPSVRLLQILPEGTPLSDLGVERLQRFGSTPTLALIQLGPSPVGADNGVELELDSIAYKESAQFADPVKVTAYSSAQAPSPQSVGIHFGDRLRIGAWSGVRAGDSLLVELRWSLAAPLRGDYSESLRVNTVDGRQILQRDREILDGATPVSEWQPGEVYADRIALPVGAAIGPFDISLVVYPSSGGPPLTSGDQQVVPLGRLE
jgi:hypothetical protein